MIKTAEKQDYEKFLDIHKLFSILSAIIIYIFWLITFALSKNGYPQELIMHIEGIELALLGIACFSLLVFVKDVFYFLTLMFFIPSVFSHSFDVLTSPIYLYTALAILLLGLIIRMIIIPVKIKLGKLSLGLCLFTIGLTLGGIGVNTEYSIIQPFIGLGLGLLLIFLYNFFISSNHHYSFKDLAYIMMVFGLFIVVQEISYFISTGNFMLALTESGIKLGWAGKNNLSLMLLMTIPFTVYLAFKSHTYHSMVIYQLAAILQLFGIFISYSRGCIAIGTIAAIIMLIGFFITFRKEKKKLIITILVIATVIAIGCTGMVILEINGANILSAINKIILNGFNLGAMNGRVPIYQKFIDQFLQKPIFGYGILYPNTLSGHVDVRPDAYQFAHSTILHTMYTCGSIGLIGLLWHLFEKYYTLIKKINIEKLTLIFAYGFSGLYGLFDVSYFYMNYMIVIVITFIFAEQYINKINYPYLGKLME